MEMLSFPAVMGASQTDFVGVDPPPKAPLFLLVNTLAFSSCYFPFLSLPSPPFL